MLSLANTIRLATIASLLFVVSVQGISSATTWGIASNEISTASANPDPFGIAHISAVNSQVPTYGAMRYQQAAAAGASWNRWVFYWHEIETTPGSFNYSPQDSTVDQDVANGFRYRIDAILMGTPGWTTTAAAVAQGTMPPPPRVGQHSYEGAATGQEIATYSGASNTVYPPQNLNLPVFADNSDTPAAGKSINQSNYWARFVYTTVARFKDRVRHWEIWNEPDYYPSAASGWYGFWAGNADQYYRLLKVGYLAAKAADPNAVIVMGGMAYWPEIVQQNLAPFTFFKRVLTLATTDSLAANNNHFFDTTAWHWYNRSNQSYYKVQDTKSVLSSYGLSSKPIWLNESGMPAWNDPAKLPPGGNNAYFGSGTMTEQASYVMQAMAYGLAAGVQRTFVFQEYDDGNGEAFGLVRNNGVPRPAYYAFQHVSRYLTGSYSASLTTVGNVQYVTANTGSGNRVVLAWNMSPSATQVSIPAQATSALLIRQPTEANPFGTQQTVTPTGGQYTISLAGATNNNGVSPSDYIVGGLVSMLVEAGPSTGSPPLATGLIANGGFDQAPDLIGWTSSVHLPVQLQSPGYSGAKKAVLGANFTPQPGLDGANSTVAQVVTLPASAQQLNLQFSYLLNTAQPQPGNLGDPFSYDKFEAILVDSSNQRHDLLVDWTGKVAWTNASIDLMPYRGQTVTLLLNVWQSAATSSYPTTVYLDDIRLWPFSSALSNVRKNSN